MIIDLSHPIHAGMPTYPGIAHLAIEHTQHPPFNFTSFAMSANTGTYLDAPRHRFEDGADLEMLPLERLADLEGLVLDVSGETAISASVFSNVGLAGKAVLFQTGWASRGGHDDYFRSEHFLTAEAADWLTKCGAAFVGIDCANVDDMKDPIRPVHTKLLRAGIPILEHMRGLEQLLGVAAFRLFAVPPAIRGGTSFPVRAFAIT